MEKRKTQEPRVQPTKFQRLLRTRSNDRSTTDVASGDTVRFRQLWQRLRKAGWTSKPPSGNTFAQAGIRGGQKAQTFFWEKPLCLMSLTRQIPPNGPREQNIIESTEDQSVRGVRARRTALVLLLDIYIDQLVVFTPAGESWMKKKIYGPVGTAYIVGRVCRRAKNCLMDFKSAANSNPSLNTFTLASSNLASKTTGPYPKGRPIKTGWNFCNAMVQRKLISVTRLILKNKTSSKLTILLNSCRPACKKSRQYRVCVLNLQWRWKPLEICTYMGMGQLQHMSDVNTGTSSNTQPAQAFCISPAVLLASSPIRNDLYAAVHGIKIYKQFTMDELMKFLGIMFFMALNDNGEYANYWGPQPEDAIFGGKSTSLDGVMSLNRYKLIRCCLSFNADPKTMDRDAAARIRPLLNILKVTGDKYVVVGRDVALDEASVACRSRQGRHMIMYNPTKPTGKCHFRLYVVCCSTSWIALNNRLHCSTSDIAERLKCVIGSEEVQALSNELDQVSTIRQHLYDLSLEQVEWSIWITTTALSNYFKLFDSKACMRVEPSIHKELCSYIPTLIQL
ncbi:LOW QUALITY PROTEIN: Transposase, partial [Phytophthora megakarya]